MAHSLIRRALRGLTDEALRNVHKAFDVFRAENLAAWTDYYVPAPRRDYLLTAPENLMILGRFGTGKTHILGELWSTLNQDPDKHGTLPILISMRGIQDTLSGIKFKYRAKHHLKEMLLVACEKLLALPTQTPWASRLQSQRKRAVHHRLVKIIEQRAIDEDFFTTRTRRRRRQRFREFPGYSPGVQTENTPPPGTSSVTQLPNSDHHSETIKECLEGIAANLGLDRVLFLIDEWDLIVPMDQQSEFAHFLKTHIMTEKMVRLRIAGDWYCMRLNDKAEGNRVRGLIHGVDIFNGVDLEVTYAPSPTAKTTHKFFRELLMKRIERHVASFSALRARDGSVHPSFIRALFFSEATFHLLILSAGGIPRDFINIFHRILLSMGSDFGKRQIRDSDVLLATEEAFRSETRGNIEEDAPYYKMLRQIIHEHLEQSKAAWFVVPRDVYTSHEHLFQEMARKRLIHRYPDDLIMPSVAHGHNVFFVSYGCLLHEVRGSWQPPLLSTVHMAYPLCDGRRIDDGLSNTRSG